jgi:hypothetical protein
MRLVLLERLTQAVAVAVEGKKPKMAVQAVQVS